jgi:hypothetical protein
MEGLCAVIPKSVGEEFDFNSRKKERLALQTNFSVNFNPLNQVQINHQVIKLQKRFFKVGVGLMNRIQGPNVDQLFSSF